MISRPFADLRSTGLLWLINTAVLHPRGFALQLHLDDQGNATGWSLDGDGTEPWEFKLTAQEKDQVFLAVNALFAAHTPGPQDWSQCRTAWNEESA